MFGEMLAEEKLTDWVINKDMLDYITRFMTQHLLDYDGHANDGKGVFPAGYTYLGQLITHDIVKSTSNQDSRTVTPWLNLDSIYPSLKSERINDFLDDAGRFKLGSL
jgi:hypothetical protein